jgi:uncharacterized protein (DUF2235 family)
LFRRIADTVGGGAFGSGLSGNVRQAYEWIVEDYSVGEGDGNGDEPWFFGFSRGAFTVRSTVGFIRTIGLLPRPLDRKALEEGYKIYVERGAKDPDHDKAETFRKDYGCIPVDELNLKFVGVWDMVDALGVPVVGPRSFVASRRWGFHDATLSSYVENAYQAIAIDERRAAFLPSLWRAPGPAESPQGQERQARQTIEQSWFAGYHSDIGGRAGDIAFHWMVGKADAEGLAFRNGFRIEEPKGVQTLHDSSSASKQLALGGQCVLWASPAVRIRQFTRA